MVFGETISNKEIVEKTENALLEIARTSYPKIKPHKIVVKVFSSSDSYFKARFSIWRYAAFQKMRHIVYVNPEAFQRGLSDKAFRAILAHEVAHVDYYTRKNRFQLAGLIRLAGSGATAEFERKADLEAIKLGFGPGLTAYRNWLYSNVSASVAAEKKSRYFTPEEIAVVMKALSEKPWLYDKWRKTIPKNLEEIRRDARN